MSPLSWGYNASGDLANFSTSAIWTLNHMIAEHHHYGMRRNAIAIVL